MPNTIAPAQTKTANEEDMYVSRDTRGNVALGGSLVLGGDLEVDGNTNVNSLTALGLSSIATLSASSLGGGAPVAYNAGGIAELSQVVIGNTRLVWGKTLTGISNGTPFSLDFNSIPPNTLPKQSLQGIFSNIYYFNPTLVNTTNNNTFANVVTSIASNQVVFVVGGGAIPGDSYCFFLAIGQAKF
jgi:hypothetical protein